MRKALQGIRDQLGPKKPEIKYGYYSAQAAAAGCGVIIYTEPRYFKEVRVTLITTDPLARQYHWEDKEFVGPVDMYVRRVELDDDFHMF